MAHSIFVTRCRLLATLAVADDDVAPEEIQFLERAMDRFGLDAEERSQAMVVLDETETEAVIGGLSQIERLGFLIELAELAWADGHLDGDEVARFEQIAGAMGFDKEDVRDALEQAKPA